MRYTEHRVIEIDEGPLWELLAELYSIRAQRQILDGEFRKLFNTKGYQRDLADLAHREDQALQAVNDHVRNDMDRSYYAPFDRWRFSRMGSNRVSSVVEKRDQFYSMFVWSTEDEDEEDLS